MGISFSFLEFFDICFINQCINNPIMVIGSQNIHETKESIHSFAQKNSYQNVLSDGSVRSLFRDRYNISEYQDWDLNEHADKKIDFGEPILPEFHRLAGTVLNSGTLEHIFKVSEAFKNIHDLTKIKGYMIHIVPVTWYNHAFFNLNPMLLRSIATSNNYEQVVEAFHFSCDPFSQNPNSGPSILITYNNKQIIKNSNAIETIFSRSTLPSNILYMTAYRKKYDSPFISPTDIQE
jgi:hypothetical protein